MATNPKIITPWASNGTKSNIPTARNASLPTNAASYDVGFPDITMTPKSQGGKAPRGSDFNGILNDITSALSYIQEGNIYNHYQAASNKGYNKGSLARADNGDVYISLIEANRNPLSAGEGGGWRNLSNLMTQDLANSLFVTQERHNNDITNLVNMHNSQQQAIDGIPRMSIERNDNECLFVHLGYGLKFCVNRRLGVNIGSSTRYDWFRPFDASCYAAFVNVSRAAGNPVDIGATFSVYDFDASGYTVRHDRFSAPGERRDVNLFVLGIGF